MAEQAHAPSHPMNPGHPSFATTAPRPSVQATAHAVRDLLREKGLTLYRAALLTRARYPGKAAWHIRRNFYFQLRSGLTPRFEQVVGLAEVTGAPIEDWLRVLGFPLGEIPRLQSGLDRPRTALIEAELVDPELRLPSLHDRRPQAALPAMAPLSERLEQTGSESASLLLARARHDFFYAKIGAEDRTAFSELSPGSIVRADPRLVRSLLPQSPGELSPHLFLLESRRGVFCASLRWVAPNRFVPAMPDPRMAITDFLSGARLRILGVVDWEFRFRRASKAKPGRGGLLLRNGAAEGNPVPGQDGPRSGAFLKRARLQAGLSFRAASEMSRKIAVLLEDSRYFASPGTLSDYEADERMPRHLHKLFTLSIVYAVRFRDLLNSYGIELERNGSRNRKRAASRERPEGLSPSFLGDLAARFGGLPLFLAGALPALTGLPRLSVRDAFWVGGQAQRHPALRGALLVLINRRSKRPRFDRHAPLRDQPTYLLQERGGSCLLASCAIVDGRLLVYDDPGAQVPERPVPRDAEVLGEVVAIARNLLRPT